MSNFQIQRAFWLIMIVIAAILLWKVAMIETRTAPQPQIVFPRQHPGRLPRRRCGCEDAPDAEDVEKEGGQ